MKTFCSARSTRASATLAFPSLFLLIGIICSSFKASCQASCPYITGAKMVTVADNGDGTSTFREDFYFANPTSGRKSIQVVVTCGSSTILSQCFDATAVSGFYSTNTFVCASGSIPPVTFNSFTGNSTCIGTYCNSVTFFGVLATAIYDEKIIEAGSGIQLQWKVDRPQMFKSFEVQRSTSANNFIDVATIHSGFNQLYSFSDPDLATGYYRIKGVLATGETVYSKVLYYQSSKIPCIKLFPNPAFSQIVLQGIKDNDSFYIVNANGQVVLTQFSNAQKVNIAALKPGLYYVKTGHSGGTSFLKE